MYKTLSRIVLIPVILIFFIVFAACDKQTTVVESTYPDQTPKVVKTYKGRGDDKILLSEKTFYQGNKIQMEGAYKENKRNGRWVYYHSNGKIWSEGFYKYGKADGRRVTYHENGKVLYDGSYKDDKRAGVWKFYDEGGKLIREIDFSSDTAKNQAPTN